MGLLHTEKKYIEKSVWMTSQSRTPFHERHFKVKGRGKKVSRGEINSQFNTAQHSSTAQDSLQNKGEKFHAERVRAESQESQQLLGVLQLLNTLNVARECTECSRRMH